MNKYGKPVLSNEGVLEIFQEHFPDRTEASIRSFAILFEEKKGGKFVEKGAAGESVKSTTSKKRKVEVGNGGKTAAVSNNNEGDQTSESSSRKKKASTTTAREEDQSSEVNIVITNDLEF